MRDPDFRAFLAREIRYELWQPVAPGPLGGRPWTMGREFEIFERLSKDHDPFELVGCLMHVRPITRTTGPARLTWLIHPQRGAALLSRCLAAFHVTQEWQAPPGAPRGGGFTRISVEPPPPNRTDHDL